jgi:solute:Na+ symporter, SSS family
MGSSFPEAVVNIYDSAYSETFFFDYKKTNFFFKDFLGGLFIAVTMTGLDQNMMQKNLSCRNLGEAQKNIIWFSIVLVIVTFCFLSLGALLYQYHDFSGAAFPVDAEGRIITDKVFPNLALNHLGVFAGMVFIIGLTAATFSSADSVLTTLTTSTYIDILELDKRVDLDEKKRKTYRTYIHIGFAILIWIVIILFELMNRQAIITTILMVAGYTYGPLLALFGAGLFTKISLKDRLVPVACIVGPLLCYLLKLWTEKYPEGYQIGYELILVNGIITFGCLLFFRKKTALQL